MMKKLIFFSILFLVLPLFTEPILFLHHSCGTNLIQQGDVRDHIDSLNTVYGSEHLFWDHGYNYQGLAGPYSDAYLGYNWNVPGDNTYACGFARIFHQEVDTTECTNFFSHVIDSSVLFAFKSCYPACHIHADDYDADMADSCRQSIYNYKRLYRNMRDIMDSWPDKFFVPLTPPPLNPASTNPTEAARARHFASWLTDTFPYEDGSHPNIAVFDFWSYLAEHDPEATDYNMLREDYRSGSDSHPNSIANETIGPIFADFLVSNLNEFLGLGLKENITDAEIEIECYPNPFNSSINIETRDFKKIEIYDIFGKRVFSSEIQKEGSLIWSPAPDITSGIYLLRLSKANKTHLRRISFVK
jgi:hypothetical protein